MSAETKPISAKIEPPDQFEKREFEEIVNRRRVAFGQKADASNDKNNSVRPSDLVGLSLSGGGLRSALFNDGFLQALSHKGVLRYVDYLASVSGGGYIAGHLMTYTKPKANNAKASGGGTGSTAASSAHGNKENNATNDDSKETDFHNDDKGNTWHLGRDPVSGKEVVDRLPGVGGYLNRSLEFFTGFVVRQLPVMLLYISAVGVIATLIAIYYRSFDAPVFSTTAPSGSCEHRRLWQQMQCCS